MRLSRRSELWISVAISAAAAAFVFAVFGGWVYDDPFITYRYADNLRGGLGPVYNPGERVLSTTTPLFALALAGLANPWLDMQRTASLIGAAGLALGGLALAELARGWGRRAAAWAALILYPTFPLLLVTMSSETPAYLALCLWTFAFAARRRFALAGVAGGLATLVRGDGALALGVVLVMLLSNWRGAPSPERSRQGRGIVVFCAAASAVIAPWLVFALAYYGSPVPVTLAVKRAQGAMAISTRFAPGLTTVVGWYLSGWQYTAEAMLALAGLAYAFARVRPALWLLAWTAAYFIAYTLLGVSGYFWYYAPLAPGFVAAVSLGIDAIAGWVGRRVRRAAALPAAALAGLLLLLQARDAIALSQLTDTRMAIYRAVGDWIRHDAPESARVGALEIGAIGYYGRRPMVDFAGLAQPDVAAALRAESTYDDSALYASTRYSPELVVLTEGTLPRYAAAYLATRCEVARRFAGPEYGSAADVVVFRCL